MIPIFNTGHPLKSRFFKITRGSILFLLLFFPGCSEDPDITNPVTPVSNGDKYTIIQTISDEAQLNTIAFDGLAILTGNVGAQSFLPPGKVADYSGFQYLRDNDLTQLGHNTDFVTIVAVNVLNILNTAQINMYISAAGEQINDINQFAYQRFPLLKAFRRLKESDFPTGTTTLSKEAVQQFVADLYKLDGRISFKRAKLFGEVINSMTSTQKAQMDALKQLNGVGNWNKTLTDPLRGMNLAHDINVAVMTYASEMYSWYAGNVTADVYFCPERQGTYFGSFFLKDWPAMGNPNYTINEQLTASAGQDFLAVLTAEQKSIITGIVSTQKSALLELVQKREQISTELRKFLSGGTADSSAVATLSARYGELDGEISYYYATAFTNVFNSLTTDQKAQLLTLAANLGYQHPTGAFLYSQPVAMPQISDMFQFFK